PRGGRSSSRAASTSIRRRGSRSAPVSPSSLQCSASIFWATGCATSSTRARGGAGSVSSMLDAAPEGDVLVVDDLSVHFKMRRATARAVDHVSFRIGRGEIVGLVGESGCGKSTLGTALLRLVPPPGEIVGGSILFGGRELLRLSSAAMRRLRGEEISL